MRFFYILVFFLISIYTKAQFGNNTSLNHPVTGSVYDLYDLDNDGDLDMISFENHHLYTGSKDQVIWFENIGGRYPNHPKLIIDSLEWILKVKGADLDNDGDGDVLVYSHMNQELLWGQNDGFGMFTFYLITTTTSAIEQIETSDLDNDNDLDIVYSLNGTAIFSIENLSSGVFGSNTLVGSGAENFRIRDVDNDNDDDIVCCINTAGYYQNNGNGVFQPFQNFLNPGSHANNVDMVDMDGDLDLDLLEVTLTDSVRVYENVGGVFTNMTTVDDHYGDFTDVRFIDVDNDNDFDVVSSNSGSNEVCYHENLGSSFAPRVVLNSISTPGLLSIVDIDLDNDDDLVYAAQGGGSGLYVRINDGSSLSNEFRVGCIMGQTDKIFTVDMDGDTDLDIVTTRPSQTEQFPHIAWHENLGGGNYSVKKSIDSVYNLKTSLLADLDGDGLPDLLKSHFNFTPSTYYRLTWEKNLGNGNFGLPVHLLNTSAGHAYDEIAVADLDSDNDLDILASRNGMSLQLYENLGGGIFAAQQTIAPTGIDECEFKDMDGDSDIDIVINYGFGGAGWYENLGALTFNPIAMLYQSTTSIQSVSVEVDDLDNDGDNDVVSVGLNPSSTSIAELWVGWNDGVANFTGTKIDSTLGGTMDVEITDVNSDGLKDIAIVTVNPARIGWYENLGNGNFGPFNMIKGTNSAMPISFQAYNKILASDIDGDADPDIICGTNNINGHTLLVENFYIGGFQYNGTVFYDVNQNGVMDGSDYGLNSLPVSIQPTSATSYADHNGDYFFATDTGTSIITHSLPGNWSLTTDSTTYTQTLSGSTPVISGLDFGYYPSTIQTELEASIVGGFPRCNSTVNYWLNVKNIGTTEPNGKFHLELDPNISYVSADVTPDSIIGQNIYWHYDTVEFFGVEQINLQVNMPSVAFIGDTLTSYLTAHEIDGFGNSVYDITDTLEQILVCAYDPNDKTVDPIGYYDEHFIADNQQLEYLIRLQNTGNDTAIDVMLRDRLDTNLDWNSLEIISSSDPMMHWLESDGEMVFKFKNIMLPDSGADFLGSQGYINFRIIPKASLDPLTRIYNKCNIYFDLNPAIITNYVFNTIECKSVPTPNVSYVNPYLSAGVSGNYTYEWYFNDTLIFGANSDTLTPSQGGNYHVIVNDSTGCYRISKTFNYVPVGLEQFIGAKYDVKIYPNPFEDYTTIEIGQNLLGYDLIIVDVLGRVKFSSRNIQTKKTIINGPELGKGMFIPSLYNADTKERVYLGKIIVK